MPYEVAEDQRADRRGAIWRWVSLSLVALLILLLVYLAYVGYAGSAQAVEPVSPSRDCRTPAMAYGWTYEVINYDAASDRALADLADPTDCDRSPAPAGDDLVTDDGVRLAGWYIPAESGVGESGPTIVLAHGHGMNKSGMLDRAALLHEDFNLVIFDFRNHGQSEDSPTTGGLLERLDVKAVVDWLVERKTPDRMGVLGVSMGGSAVINEAVGDNRVEAVAVESTHATLANALAARLGRQGYPLGLPGAWAILFGGLVRTGQDMSAADPVQAAERIGDRPFLVVGAGHDDAVGAEDAADLAAAGREGGAEVELETCEPAGHGGSPEACPDDYAAWVLGFFTRTIGSGS